jgi:hypothetical protein
MAMELVEKVLRGTFLLLFGLLFAGVFASLALETAIRRWRQDRLAAEEPAESDLEAAYRARPKTQPTVERRALPPIGSPG